MAKRKKGTDREKHPFHHIILRVYHLNAHSKFNPRFIYFHPHKKWLLALIKLIENVLDFFFMIMMMKDISFNCNLIIHNNTCFEASLNVQSYHRKQVHHQNVINNVEIDLFLHLTYMYLLFVY